MRGYDSTFFDDDSTRDDLRAEAAANRRYHALLCRHPDPRDPEWPGHCEPEDTTEQETEEPA